MGDTLRIPSPQEADAEAPTVRVPIDPYPCPLCGKPVTLISPSWLRIRRNYVTRKAKFAVRPHVLDCCLDCAPITPATDSNRMRRERIGLNTGFIVYHLTGMWAPTRVSHDKPVRRDEYCLILPFVAPEDWAYSAETIRNPNGQLLHLLFVAQALAVEGIPSPITTYWRGDVNDGRSVVRSHEIENDDRLSLRQRIELVELTTLASEIPARTDHTRESVERQLADYLARLPVGAKPSKERFIGEVLDPSISERTWANYMRKWRTNWRQMVQEQTPRR